MDWYDEFAAVMADFPDDTFSPWFDPTRRSYMTLSRNASAPVFNDRKKVGLTPANDVVSEPVPPQSVPPVTTTTNGSVPRIKPNFNTTKEVAKADISVARKRKIMYTSEDDVPVMKKEKKETTHSTSTFSRVYPTVCPDITMTSTNATGQEETNSTHHPEVAVKNPLKATIGKEETGICGNDQNRKVAYLFGAESSVTQHSRFNQKNTVDIRTVWCSAINRNCCIM
uniref:TPX2 domain-containing protein n=1 Tax=Panagrellus redivivus TaxID=6233 RepID=A0A7E4W689_PANRE